MVDMDNRKDLPMCEVHHCGNRARYKVKAPGHAVHYLCDDHPDILIGADLAFNIPHPCK